MTTLNENETLKTKNFPHRRCEQANWLALAMLVLFAPAVSLAQEKVEEIKQPDAKFEKCFEISLDFEKGISLAWRGKAEIRYKQFERKLKRYVRHNQDDEETKELLDFLEKEVGPYMPDYFKGDYDALLKINEVAEKDAKKKAWLEGAIGGKAEATKGSAVGRVKAYQPLKVYDDKAIGKGYAQANINMPQDLKILGLKIFTFDDVKSAGASVSDTITIYKRPNGKPQAEVKANAKMWALDGTDGWVRVTYVNDEGELVWGYVLGPKVRQKAMDFTDKPVPASGKGKEEF